MRGWYILRMDRPPVRAGNHVHAHIGSSTVAGRVARVWRDVLVLEDAVMVLDGGDASPIDGTYHVPIATPMQVLADGPRAAGGVAA